MTEEKLRENLKFRTRRLQATQRKHKDASEDLKEEQRELQKLQNSLGKVTKSDVEVMKIYEDEIAKIERELQAHTNEIDDNTAVIIEIEKLLAQRKERKDSPEEEANDEVEYDSEAEQSPPIERRPRSEPLSMKKSSIKSAPITPSVGDFASGKSSD